MKSLILNSQIKEPIDLDYSARSHRTAIIDQWHRENSIKRIDWPGNSPDLNPIENLWSILKSKLRKTPNIT